jgi:hypothetical protein
MKPDNIPPYVCRSCAAVGSGPCAPPCVASENDNADGTANVVENHDTGPRLRPPGHVGGAQKPAERVPKLAACEAKPETGDGAPHGGAVGGAVDSDVAHAGPIDSASRTRKRRRKNEPTDENVTGAPDRNRRSRPGPWCPHCPTGVGRAVDLSVLACTECGSTWRPSSSRGALAAEVVHALAAERAERRRTGRRCAVELPTRRRRPIDRDMLPVTIPPGAKVLARRAARE